MGANCPYLASPAAQSVRTNSHVERTDRRLRFLEEVLCTRRRRRTLLRFMAPTSERWRWIDRAAPTR